VELDRQSIERKDFPIGRRGYDPAAVDAHLRALAVEVDELRRSAASGATDVSLAASAGTKVQVIVEAAEAAAAEIERHAAEAARQVREAADRDAERTREEAIEQARAHVAAVSQAAATLLERVGGMDAEVRALVDSLNTGAGRLAADLGAVETNMAELYDAAAGAAPASAAQQPGPEPTTPPAEAQPAAPGAFEAELAGAMAAAPTASEPQQEPAQAEQPKPAPAEGGAEDLDGARLIALNMALNGESRADTERYLAENFELADRGKLVEEVYAAIEG
jgi:DivIVA domain-containing protein